MAKTYHEIRDPIYGFIKLDSQEREVLNSWPVQRLRYIHQLGLSYLVYPGASHKRFEHSLGVMELAGRVFDTVTNCENVTDKIRALFPEISRKDGLGYWRRVLRMAGLCHDIGHLPFSHTAEKDLLPAGWNHERLTRAIIESDEMQGIWRVMTPRIVAEDVVKLALGNEKASGLEFTDWETLLAEIIVGDALGVDRMDYLLRDAHHVGVPYGSIDYHRIIDSLRILTPPPSVSRPSERPTWGEEEGAVMAASVDADQSVEPSLGVTEGALHSAEALLLARYFMYTQVYFHPVTTIYGIHLKDFLNDWLNGGKFSTEVNDVLKNTDNEVMAEVIRAGSNDGMTGHDAAARMLHRQHFRLLYTPHPEDLAENLSAADLICEAAKNEFGSGQVRFHPDPGKTSESNFPVEMRDGRIASAVVLSRLLEKLPVPSGKYVFVHPDLREKAIKWLEKKRKDIIQRPEEEGSE